MSGRCKAKRMDEIRIAKISLLLLQVTECICVCVLYIHNHRRLNMESIIKLKNYNKLYVLFHFFLFNHSAYLGQEVYRFIARCACIDDPKKKRKKIILVYLCQQ